MKEDVFNQYVDKIVEIYRITKEELFMKSKQRHIVDARQLLYYLCYKRHINLIIIQKFMGNNGYKISHNSVSHGIKSVESKIEEDRDYKSIASDIERSVFI